MNVWLDWFLGAIVWFFCILFLAILAYLTAARRPDKIRGNFPDSAFAYHYRPKFLPPEGFFLDTHSHTIESDGWLTAEQNILWHIANGFHAMVVTDHNTTAANAPSLALQEKYPGILIIPGIEWTSARVHLNFLGISEWSDKIPVYNPSDDQVREAIAKAKAMGAVVQCDHFSWTVDQPPHRRGDLVHPTREQLVEWGVDGFEINNEMRWYDPLSLHWLDARGHAKPDGSPLYIATGTDIHNPLKEWATGWTELLLTPEERDHPTAEVVLRALREARTKIWVDHDYRQPPEIALLKDAGIKQAGDLSIIGPRQEIFAPLYGLVKGVTEVPGTLRGIISYVAWFLLLYFPLRLLFTWMLGW